MATTYDRSLTVAAQIFTSAERDRPAEGDGVEPVVAVPAGKRDDFDMSVDITAKTAAEAQRREDDTASSSSLTMLLVVNARRVLARPFGS